MKAKKVWGSLILAVALTLGLVGAAAPNAVASSKTEKVTLLKGEQYKISILMGGSVKSAKSSNNSVISVKKDGSYAVVCKAKKAGKSTVTIRASRGGSKKYIFTVKTPKIDCSVESIAVSQNTSGTYNSVVAIKIVNKSGVYIPTATISYALGGEGGTVLEKKTLSVADLVPGEPIYKTVDYTYKDTPVYTADAVSDKYTRYSAETKYANRSKDISVNQTGGDFGSGKLSFTIKNTSKKTVSGSADVLFLNAEGQIIYVRGMSFYLKGKEVTTTEVSYIPQGAVDCRVVTRAYERM